MNRRHPYGWEAVVFWLKYLTRAVDLRSSSTQDLVRLTVDVILNSLVLLHIHYAASHGFRDPVTLPNIVCSGVQLVCIQVCIVCIQEHRYYHSELEIHYHDPANGWTFVSACAWKNSVNVAIRRVGMLLSPCALNH